MADLTLDACFFIDLRRAGDDGARQIWRTILTAERTASFSPVTVYELWVGQRFSREEEVFYRAMFEYLSEAEMTTAIAETAGVWMRQEANRPENLVRDAFIAATAQSRNEVICTRNIRDFELFGVPTEAY